MPDPFGGSSNGRTADSESVYRGSNPLPPAETAPKRAVFYLTYIISLRTFLCGSRNGKFIYR